MRIEEFKSEEQSIIDSKLIWILPETISDSIFKEIRLFNRLYDGVCCFSSAKTFDAIKDDFLQLQKYLQDTSTKRITCIGYAQGSFLAQYATLELRKITRRIILFNPTMRAKPKLLRRIFEAIEKISPLGLPVTIFQRRFDSRHFVHRIHCPTLVVQDKYANDYQISQTQEIAQRIPNAWINKISTLNDNLFQEQFALFMGVPAKRPQKNRGNGS